MDSLKYCYIAIVRLPALNLQQSWRSNWQTHTDTHTQTHKTDYRMPSVHACAPIVTTTHCYYYSADWDKLYKLFYVLLDTSIKSLPGNDIAM